MLGNQMIFIVCEQAFVILILLIHLTGFVVLPSSNSSQKPSKEEYEVSIEKSPYYVIHQQASLKTILIVIDGLREDHLSTANRPLMPFSSSLIKEGKGIVYSVKTASPTVTSPRVKSILSGIIPDFLEVISNFAASEIKRENIIHLSSKKGLNIEFYGDKLWLDLFPGVFRRSDGVTSFYVSDYTEVDLNVTRHLTNILPRNDWDVLILHYLGLDHIGHLQGPSSPLIEPKLREMDQVIHLIDMTLKSKGDDPYLVVVCGDHGMSDIGGHGGSTHSEIWTSALFFSSLATKNVDSKSALNENRVANQVDLASTLAAFLGIEVPADNVGAPLFDVLRWLPVDVQLTSHYKISRQLFDLSLKVLDSMALALTKDMFKGVCRIHSIYWLRNQSSLDVSRILAEYHDYESLVSSMLLDSLRVSSFFVLFGSSLVLLMFSLPIFLWHLFASKDLESPIHKLPFIFLVLILSALPVTLKLVFGDYFPCVDRRFIPACLVVAFSVAHLIHFAQKFTEELNIKQFLPRSASQLVVFVGVISHPFSLFATSFVEEEHFFFYFLMSVLHFTFIVAFSLSFIRTHFHKTFSNRSSVKLTNLQVDTTGFDNDAVMPTSSREMIRMTPLCSLENDLLSVFNNRAIDRGLGKPKSLTRYLIVTFLLMLSWLVSRFLRSYFPNGDKWKNLSQLTNVFSELEGKYLMFLILFALSLYIFLYKPYWPFALSFSSCLMLKHCLWFHREDSVESNRLAQACYIILMISASCIGVKLIRFKGKTKNMLSSGYQHEQLSYPDFTCITQVSEFLLASLLLLLQKPENLLASVLFIFHFHLLVPILVRNYSLFSITESQLFVVIYWIGQFHFFSLGNSNSFSTIQINSGFVGVTFYAPFLHGFLISWNTFGPRLLVYLHASSVLVKNSGVQSIRKCLRCWWVLQLYTLTVYVFNVTMQRHHLFIWSVFAPKLLYEESHFLSLCVCVVFLFSISALLNSKKGVSM